MIISHKYHFIFIKTRKTAGTSIEIFLSQVCGPEDALTPIRPPMPPHQPRNHRGFWNPLPEMLHAASNAQRLALWQDFRQRRKFYNHIPARTLRQRLPAEIWSDYFTFCVERNPWDKTLSHYAMVNQRAGDALTFDDYLNGSLFCTDFEKYADKDGQLMVDEVLRYESLMDDLGRVFQDLGIPFAGDLGVRAKSDYRKDRRPYQEVYSEKQRDFVARLFAREIALFDYHF